MHRIAALPLSLCFLLACSSRSGPSLIEQYAAANDAANCALDECNGVTPAANGDTVCADLAASTSAATLQADVDAGRLKFDATAAPACIAFLETVTTSLCWGENAPSLATLQAEQTAACGAVVSPAVVVGGACYLDTECTTGICDAGATCPGKCDPLGVVGAACDDDTQCAAGLYCGFDDNGNSACEAHLAVGGDCSEDSDCQAGLVCFQPSDPNANDACAVPATSGESCVATNCAGNLACDPTSNTCVTPSAPGAVGATCSAVAPCVATAECAYASDTATTGTCTALGATGAACSNPGLFIFGDGSASDCLGHQMCVGVDLVLDSTTMADATTPGKCAVPSDLGGGCVPKAANFDDSGNSGFNALLSVTGCYAGLVCDPTTSTCRLPPGVGSPCIEEQCDATATCDTTSNCVALPAIGSDCINDTCAANAYCDMSNSANANGSCIALAANGTACTDPTACQSGNCGSDSKCDPAVPVCAVP